MAQVEGPKVEVGNSGLNVRVTSSYRSGDDDFRGMVTIALGDSDLIEVEGNLKDGKDGKWFAPPSRSYEDNNGNTKWKNLVWFSSRRLSNACAEAVEAYIEKGSRVDDSDIPL